MNIFNKVAMQGLKKNRTRTIVTIIGVILSAAMITAVTTFGVSLMNYMAEVAASKYGDWQVAYLDADSSFKKEISSDKKVEKAVSFENIALQANRIISISDGRVVRDERQVAR